VKSRLELDRATGLLLDHSGIMMDDAVRGQVTHTPSVPYVEPRQNPESVMPPPPGQVQEQMMPKPPDQSQPPQQPQQ
jgi:hypothetical protein